MKKISVILGCIAVLASTLFVSCIKEKEPEWIAAPPSNRFAEYIVNDKGERAWSIASADQWTNGNYWSGFTHFTDTDPIEVLRYAMFPNVEWTASIAPGSEEYIMFRVGKYGGDAFTDDYTLQTSCSGRRGYTFLQVIVIKTPAVGEEAVKAVANVTMGGETTPIITLTIHPDVE